MASSAQNEAGPNPCGLREQKKRQTSQDLHRAALDLVHEDGLEAATINKIAESAGVSPRTFFNYYRSKEAAILGIPDNVDQAVLAAFAARPDEEPVWDSLIAVSVDVFLHDPYDQKKARAVLARYPEISRSMMDAADRGREAGLASVSEKLIAQGANPASARARAHVLIEVGAAVVSAAAHIVRNNPVEMREALDFARTVISEDIAKS